MTKTKTKIPLLLVVVFLALDAEAVWLDLPPSGTKCMSEEIQPNIVVLADYSIIYEGHAHSAITIAIKRIHKALLKFVPTIRRSTDRGPSYVQDYCHEPHTRGGNLIIGTVSHHELPQLILLLALGMDDQLMGSEILGYLRDFFHNKIPLPLVRDGSLIASLIYEYNVYDTEPWNLPRNLHFTYGVGTEAVLGYAKQL